MIVSTVHIEYGSSAVCNPTNSMMMMTTTMMIRLLMMMVTMIMIGCFSSSLVRLKEN